MKTYFESILTRLEAWVDGRHVAEPRQFKVGDYVGIMIMLVEDKDTVMGIRGDKFEKFLMGICEEHAKELKANLAMNLLQITDSPEGDDRIYGASYFDKALWDETNPGEAMPIPPLYVSVKDKDTIKFDYNQVQNFAWNSAIAHEANPIPHNKDAPLYLDIEYFFKSMLTSPPYFGQSIDVIVAYLMHFTKADDEWGKEVHARLVKMHYILVFKSDLFKEIGTIN